MSQPPDSTARFSNRVADYIRHRPGYPAAMLRCLADEHGLRSDHVVADIGCGTGLSAEPFLRNGNTVIGVEPNEPMRRAGGAALARFERFRMIAGSAEQTTLADASVDWVVAGQAFHWFDVPRARAEFLRILRPGGRVALVWNNRRENTPFLSDYEALLQEYATDYAAVKHQNVETDGRIEQLYGPGRFALRTFENRQPLDFDGLRGRTLSASYIPPADDPRTPALERALLALFDRHARDGRVTIEYATHLYIGGLEA